MLKERSGNSSSKSRENTSKPSTKKPNRESEETEKTVIEGNNPCVQYGSKMGVCPVCNLQFGMTLLSNHVEQCIAKQQENISCMSQGECPICAKQFSVTVLEVHVNQCVDMLT